MNWLLRRNRMEWRSRSWARAERALLGEQLDPGPRPPGYSLPPTRESLIVGAVEDEGTGAES